MQEAVRLLMTISERVKTRPTCPKCKGHKVVLQSSSFMAQTSKSAGSSSSDIRSSATFTVTGQTRAIRGEDRAFLSVATVGS
jgi:hypothetical protein